MIQYAVLFALAAGPIYLLWIEEQDARAMTPGAGDFLPRFKTILKLNRWSLLLCGLAFGISIHVGISSSRWLVTLCLLYAFLFGLISQATALLKQSPQQ